MDNRRKFLGLSAAALSTGVLAKFVSRTQAGIQETVADTIGTQEEGKPISLGSESDAANLAQLYSLESKVNYLNHASIGCIPIPCQTARMHYLDLVEKNPWLRMWSDEWVEPVKEVRNKAARLLGCDAENLAITHNTTEMFNTLANGLPLQSDDEVLFSTLCHSGASLPFLYRAEQGRYQARRFEFPLGNVFEITSSELVEIYAREITSKTRVLVIPHIDNTVGLRYPLAAMAKMARDKGVEFVVVDAAQTPGMIDVNATQAKVDVIATSGHKWIGGPKGTGLAYVRSEMFSKLEPMWVTWGQQRWSKSARKYEDYGTRNLPEVLALGDSIDFLNRIELTQRETRLEELREYTQGLVESTGKLEWVSPKTWAMGGSLYAIGVPKPATKLARRVFEESGIVVRPFQGPDLNHLRVSPNVFTTRKQIQQLISLIS